MSKLSRLVIGYIVAIPLALTLGFLVATPDVVSVATVGMIFLFLAIPMMLHWNHAFVIVTWNSAFVLGFLQGEPQLWLVFAALAFGIAMLNNVIGLKTFLRAPELTKPILLLLGVVVATALVRGGFGLRILGTSSFGGKKYIYIVGAIVGYFALTSQRIPLCKSDRMVKWFFLSSVTYAFGNFIYVLGPAFYVLYDFISPDFIAVQVAADLGQNVVERFSGLGACATGVMCFALARWGLGGTLKWKKPWRLLIVAVAMAAGLFSGYRSQVAFLLVLLAIQFALEGLWRTTVFPVLCFVGVVGMAPVLLFANKMPAAVQRSLAALPLNIDPDVRAEAMDSTEWRIQLWREVLPDVPKYLFLGKGYAIDPIDLYLTNEASRTGIVSNNEALKLAGDYHNGPLSVLIPFGLLGAFAFFWLLWAGTKVLYNNYCYGEAQLRKVNIVLLAYFIAQTLFFFFVFGAISSQLAIFLGLLGLSVSLNGGVCRKAVPKAVPSPLRHAFVLEPA